VILAINILLLIWVIAASVSGPPSPEKYIGVLFLVVFWAFVEVILGVIWLVTRPKARRTCPACRAEVKTGMTVCPSCGHDFRAAASGPATPPLPPPPTI
jgi:hypothetical protein